MIKKAEPDDVDNDHNDDDEDEDKAISHVCLKQGSVLDGIAAVSTQTMLHCCNDGDDYNYYGVCDDDHGHDQYQNVLDGARVFFPQTDVDGG